MAAEDDATTWCGRGRWPVAGRAMTVPNGAGFTADFPSGSPRRRGRVGTITDGPPGEYLLPADGWSEGTATLPVEGALQRLRL